MKEKKSLLFALTASDLAQIETLDDLRKEKYEIHYLIDTFDAILYSFPFGLRDSVEGTLSDFSFKDKSSLHLLADAQVALNYLFKKNTSSKSILPAQYNAEIKKTIANARKDLKKFHEENELTTNFGQALTRNRVNDIKYYIENNLSLLTTIALASGKFGFSRFFDLFKSQSIILESDYKNNQLESANDADVMSVYKEFESEINKRPFEYYLKGYEEFIKRNIAKPNRTEFYEYVDMRRGKALKNAFNDSLVIARALKTNTESIKIGQGTIYIYVSSTKISSTVFERIEHLLPKYNFNFFNFHQNVAHIFGDFCLFQNSSNENFSPEIDDIRALLFTEQQVSKKDYISKNEWEERLDKLRNNLENYSLLLKYGSFIDDLKRISKSQISNSLIPQDVKKVISFYRKVKNDNNYFLDDWNDLLKNLTFYDRVRNFLVVDKKSFVDRNFGSDPIESIKQQLPIVFDYSSFSEFSENLEVLKNLSSFYLENSPNASQIAGIREYVANYVLNSIKDEEEIQNSLIHYLIYLTIPIPLAQNQKEPNEFIVEEVEELIKRFRAVNKPETYKKLQYTLIKELRYVQVWAARRAKLYSKGLEISAACMELYPSDPRFYHSSCLLRYCVEFDNFFQTSNIEIDNLKASIESGEKAIPLYFRLIDLQANVEARHSIEALYNTLLFNNSAYAYYYIEVNKNDNVKIVEHALNKAHKCLENLKEWIDKYGQFNKYPEYLASEALFYLTRYKMHHESNDLEIAKVCFKKAYNKLKQNNKKVRRAYDFIGKQIDNLGDELQKSWWI
ncbi:hypothetical protein QQ008_08955 [Fulvivirgaceae bacterium BMA10]|uniref:Uncharacterized protein n=1 Tax=Splendidivirga corallicola TaxID=3051826 RepID=A0ABT8KLA9_9BACT|nr:hypothetical protein [Fulvivirgaceae bacterium BMA10]